MALSNTIPASQLDSTFGCLFIAIVFSSVLWGIGCLQLYLYYEKYWKSDQTWFKAYIFLIWVLDTVQQVLISHVTYVYFVRGIGDQTLLTVLPKTSSYNAVIIPIIDTMVQIIFVRRAWYISNKNIILTGFLFLAVLGQLTVGLAYCSTISGFAEMVQLSGIVHLEIALNCVTAFTDTVIAFAIMLLLWKSRSGIKRTDSIISRLIMYTVGSSLVTALVSLVALIGAIVAPNFLVYLLCDLLVPKLYVNCMLASLNARSSLRGDLGKGTGGLSIRLENFPSNVASDTSNKVPTHRHVELHSTIDIEGGGEKRQAWGDSSTAV